MTRARATYVRLGEEIRGIYIIKRALKGKVMHTFRDSSAFARNIVPRKVINGPPRTPARNPRVSRRESPFSGLVRDPISERSRYFRAEMSYFFQVDTGNPSGPAQTSRVNFEDFFF